MVRHSRLRPLRPRSSTACTESRADTSPWRSSSRTTWSFSKEGQSEARGLAILAETKRLIPQANQYVVNTHPHFDHAGGLGPFAAEGHHDSHRRQQQLPHTGAEPRTLVGDTLAKSGKKPKVEGVVEKMVIKDDTRTIELHHITDLEHSDGMLIAYLPKERILFSADFNMPAQGQPVSPSIATLLENIERLQLDLRPTYCTRPQPGSEDDQSRPVGACQGGQ